MVASLGKWRVWLGEAVHYCLCTGHSSSLLLGMVERVTTLEGSLSGPDTYTAPSGGAEYITMTKILTFWKTVALVLILHAVPCLM